MLPPISNAQTSEPLYERMIAVAWSPDDTLIAIGGGVIGCSNEQKESFSVRILSAENHELLQTLTEGTFCQITSLSWNPDGTMIASSSIDGTSIVWSIESGEVVATTEIFFFGRDDLMWSPNGEMIADIWGEDFRFEIWDPATGETIQLVENHSFESLLDLDWSPDSTQIVTGGGDQTAMVWDVEVEEIRFILNGHEDTISSVDWSPDGSMIATGSYDDSIRIWDAQTGDLMQIIECGTVWELAWHPSSQYLANAVLDGEIQIWEIASGEQVTEIESEVGRIEDLAWNAAGDALAYVGSYTGYTGQNLQVINTSELLVTE